MTVYGGREIEEKKGGRRGVCVWGGVVVSQKGDRESQMYRRQRESIHVAIDTYVGEPTTLREQVRNRED